MCVRPVKRSRKAEVERLIKARSRNRWSLSAVLRSRLDGEKYADFVRGSARDPRRIECRSSLRGNGDGHESISFQERGGGGGVDGAS